MQLVALLLLSTIPSEDITREQCDLAEINHFYDEQGRLVFDQIIFYDWCPHALPVPRYQVRAWRLVKGPCQIPERDWAGGGYASTWLDGEIVRNIRADSIRETWTQFDPELAEREYLKKEQRRELIKDIRGLTKRPIYDLPTGEGR